MSTVFFDSYTRNENGGIYVEYRSGNTVYEECFSDGELTACGWNCAGYDMHTNTVPCVARLNPAVFQVDSAFRLEIDGTDLYRTYEWVSYEKEEKDGVLHISVKLKSTLKPVTVTVHTLLDGSNILVRYLTVENLGNSDIAVSGLSVMSGPVIEERIPDTDGMPPYELGYMQNSQSHFEGDFHWLPLPRNTYSFGKHTYAERYRHPFFAVRNKKGPEIFIGQLAYSGGYEFSFHNYASGHSLSDHMSFEAKIVSRNPVYLLTQGESLVTPSMHAALLHDDFDGAIQEFHRHVRTYCNGYEKHPMVESGIGPEVNMCEENVFRAIDTAQQLGAEVFFIDASWYSPAGGESDWPAYTGDWNPEVFRYSCSMNDIRDYAHERGLKFGLWMDVEKLGPKSKAIQNPDIPKLHDYAGKMTVDGNSGILDFSEKAGTEWAFEQICDVIDRYELDFFRLDSGAYSYTSAKPVSDTRENRDLRYYNNFYEVFRRLREKYPNVIFQNCAGGGARLDLGLMQMMSNTWVTDNQIAPGSYRVINGVSMLLPPEYLVRPIGAQGGHLKGTLDFQINVARFGNPLLFCVLDCDITHSPLLLDKIAKMSATYKETVRPMMLSDCRVFHHTPELRLAQKDSVGILEIASKDGDCSMLGIFTLSQVTEPQKKVRFKGLKPSGRYAVTVNDEYLGEFSGYELTFSGLVTEIETAIDSKVFIAKKVNQ
ncbi:MAG: alpha-galactosidase [Clostridia bacterium]|nr:alpha-galactosidase [Clostridia bacterium]